MIPVMEAIKKEFICVLFLSCIFISCAGMSESRNLAGHEYERGGNYEDFKNAGSEVLLEKENQDREAVQKASDWDKRIAEHPHLYPAPFEGRWQLSLPEYITTKTKTVYSLEPYYVQMKGNVVYEFTGKNYTCILNGQIIRQGSFFYNSGRIELDDGTLLLYAGNVVMLGNQQFIKQ